MGGGKAVDCRGSLGGEREGVTANSSFHKSGHKGRAVAGRDTGLRKKTFVLRWEV